jgi:hypothetical protein
MAKKNNNETEINSKDAAQFASKEGQFRINRIQKLKQLYSDEPSMKRRYDQTATYKSGTYANAKAVRDALNTALTNRDTVVETSKKLYAINPIYASVIDYISNMYTWRYKVLPHKVYSKSKAKLKKKSKPEDFQLIYNLMLEAADGLSIETKFPAMLSLLYINGAVYFTTFCDEESITIDTMLLPDKYCRKVGETQYGTNIIQFNFSYFQDLGLKGPELQEMLKSFPKEFQSGYRRFLSDSTQTWQTLDPHYSSALLLNEMSIPTYLYLLGGILDYEKYQDNELERSDNLLKYLVVHKMPHYEDNLIFEVDEVEAIHQSLKRIVDTGEKARLITTYGDVDVNRISESDTSENQVLSKAFQAIFNNAGFNSGLFTGESVTALEMSLIRDKGRVWKHVQALLNFYTIAINNWFEFKDYQADIDILPISPYTYNDDITKYKENATIGVGKLDYVIASGIKQKNIQDQLYLEDFLKLDEIKPMQTSYTQTAEDRSEDAKDSSQPEKANDNKTEIEPSDNKNQKEPSGSQKTEDELNEETNN